MSTAGSGCLNVPDHSIYITPNGKIIQKRKSLNQNILSSGISLVDQTFYSSENLSNVIFCEIISSWKFYAVLRSYNKTYEKINIKSQKIVITKLSTRLFKTTRDQGLKVLSANFT